MGNRGQGRDIIYLRIIFVFNQLGILYRSVFTVKCVYLVHHLVISLGYDVTAG
jgi:hypothetical protein